jgi:hypothetical protein
MFVDCSLHDQCWVTRRQDDFVLHGIAVVAIAQTAPNVYQAGFNMCRSAIAADGMWQFRVGCDFGSIGFPSSRVPRS